MAVEHPDQLTDFQLFGLTLLRRSPELARNCGPDEIAAFDELVTLDLAMRSPNCLYSITHEGLKVADKIR